MPPASDLTSFVRHDADGTARMDFAVDGVTCAACIGAIEGALRPLAGLGRARLNYTSRRLAVEWSDAAFDPSRVVEDLARIGYRAYPFAPSDVEAADAAHMRWLLRCLAVAGFAAMNVMLLSVSIWAGEAGGISPETRDVFHWLSALIVLPSAAFAGQPFLRSALASVKARRLNMDVPISLGIILALAMSVVETARHAAHAYFDSAIMLILFLLVGRTLDLAMRRRTRAVAANLAALRSPTASRLTPEGELVTVPVRALAAGDIVLVRPGERVPVDGVLVGGSSKIDESLLTGETRHQATQIGRTVYAGTLNVTGTLRIAVHAATAGTMLDEIERLIDTAAAAKSRYVRLADRVSRLYAPVVHATAAATAIGWLLAGASVHDAVVVAIAVLIITCPCALALAIPTVQVVASGALFKAGILLNAGDAIERFAGVDTIVFDKTGTLTLPEPGLIEVGPATPALLETAARLALASHHPLARALARRAALAIPFTEATEVAGQGVSAMIDESEARLGSPAFCGLERAAAEVRAGDPTASLIAFRHGARSVIFLVRQRLREDAGTIADALRQRGLALSILSGDRMAPVEEVARAIGVADWHAAATPSEKIAHVERLKAEGRTVLMVGDGMNDAPALAAAHVSLSPITAADIAQASADAVFLGDRLRPVLDVIAVSRHARMLMGQNLALALIYNCLAVPLAMSGHVTPLIAAVAMSGSSILVTLNALRAGRPPTVASNGRPRLPSVGRTERVSSPPAGTAPREPHP